jgi:hypothetical protein
MGCKNMGQTHYESSMPPDMKPYEMQVYPVPHLHPGQVMQSAARASAATKKSEQPLQAAQNLAFLKHSTPEKATGGSDKENPDESVNTLMMAAYAMTEFGQGSSPSKSRYDSKKREAEAALAEAKKDDDGDGNNDGGNEDDDEESSPKRAKL